MDYNRYPASAELSEMLSVTDLNECKKFPKYFQIGTVNFCNAHCSMCPHRYGSQYNEPISMSDELFSKILNQLKEFKDWIEFVSVYWLGEPLLDKKIFKRVYLLRNVGIKGVSISTNAELMEKITIKKLFDSGITDLRISLDGFTKEVYENIRIGLHFDKVVENTHKAIQIRNEFYQDISIRLRFVSQPQNEHEWKFFKEYWDKFLNPKLDKIQRIKVHSKEEWSIKQSRTPPPPPPPPPNFDSLNPCTSLFSTLIIDSDGKVLPCCMDASKKLVIGDVNKDSLKEVWQSPFLEKIREVHLKRGRMAYPICVDCDCWIKRWEE